MEEKDRQTMEELLKVAKCKGNGELFLLQRLQESAGDWRRARYDADFAARYPDTEADLEVAVIALESYLLEESEETS